MFDSKRLLDQLVNSGFAGGLAGGAAGAAVMNALSGKKAKKYAGTALKAGGLALIGGLAYKAWQHHKKDAAPAQDAPPPAAFVPETPEDSSVLNMLLIRSMIAAARADGSIDSTEHQAIMSRIGELQLDDAEKAYLFEQFAAPVDVYALAKDADTEAHAAEMYAASALIVSSPSPEEQQYLNTLAAALRLPTGLQEEIHRAIESQPAAA